jgi:ketosteroid isomerase-like protein
MTATAGIFKSCVTGYCYLFDVPPPFQSVGIEAYKNTWDTFFKYTKQGVFDIQDLMIFADNNIAFCIATMKCDDSTGGKGFIIHEHHSIPSTYS